MDRRLVLGNEAARHPFRRALPPPVAELVDYARQREPLGSVGLFALTFVSAFLAFASFLA